MIYPTTDDVLAALIDTFDRYIVPEVHDEYAASLCLTVSQVLRAVKVRIAQEGQALYEDNRDLRNLLSTLRTHVDAATGAAVEEALTPPPASGYITVESLQDDALSLRRALVTCIERLPDRHGSPRVAIREYLTRHLERQAPWASDAFTGPRR